MKFRAVNLAVFAVLACCLPAAAQMPPGYPAGFAAPAGPGYMPGPYPGMAPVVPIDMAAGGPGGAPHSCPSYVRRVPNFMGDGYARPLGEHAPLSTSAFAGTETFFIDDVVEVGSPSDAPLTFAVGGGPYTGPNGPVPGSIFVTSVLDNSQIIFTAVGDPPFALNEDTVLSANVGGIFVSGIGVLSFTTNPTFPRNADSLNDLFRLTYTYEFGAAGLVLANPSGGGLVGRNKYFENGSPVPRDRVYAFYSHLGQVGRGRTARPDINRWVVGMEKTLFCDMLSLEVRLPFAGTVSSTQTLQGGARAFEIGNVGLLFKVALYETDTFLFSAGLGVSLPTTDDTLLIASSGERLVEIENRTTLLQPIVGCVWAPTDRFFAQAGLQIDTDPRGNLVKVLDTPVGALEDQSMLYASGGIGYWLLPHCDHRKLSIAWTGELHYNAVLGSRDFVEFDVFRISDFGNPRHTINFTSGFTFDVCQRLQLAVGATLPFTERLHEVSGTVQLNARLP